MARPDVRVRLSAEGVSEVVSALKRIQTEGQKASAKSKVGFSGLNRALGGTAKLLGGIGIALGVRQFTRFIGGAIEAADQINKLGAKVGATTENLSALQLVARTADSDLNQLGSALVRMNKNIADSEAGVTTAVAALRDLDLVFEDFDKKDSVEIFALISERINELPTSMRKGRSAIAMFGKAGAMLLPTMKALAEEGLGNVIKRAEELGVLIDYDLAKAAEKIKDDVEILKMQSEAIGVHFIAGFGPEMSKVLQTVSGDLRSTTHAWEEFGEGIGTVLKYVVGIVSAAADVVTTIFGGLAVTLVSLGKTIVLAMSGNFKGAKQELATHQRWFDKEYAGIAERMKARFEVVTKVTPESEADGTAGGTAGGTAAELAELAARKAQALATSLDRELMIVKAAAKLKTKAEQREFEEGLQSAAVFYADRRAILEAGLAEELRVLEEKKGLLDQFTDPARRLQEEKKIDTQLAQARMEHEDAIAELLVEERDTIRDLAEERLDLERTLLEMQGRRFEAERMGFEAQITQADLLLKKQGASDAEREEALARLRTALEAGVDFDEAKANAEAALAELAAARDEIEAQAAAGLLAEVEAETQLLEIEMERLDTLRVLAEALEVAALATGDPEKIEQAQAYTAAINEMAYALDASAGSWTQFKTTALDSTQSALEDFFATGLDGSKSLKDSMKSMALAIIGDLKRLAAQLLATWIMKKIAGFFGAGGEVGGEVQGPMPAAVGGLIRGPGTRTSDSILAALSTGEFVTRASIVEEPGVLKHLRELNRYGARSLAVPRVLPFPAARFAEGGLVGGAGSSEAAGMNGRLVLGLEDGLVLKEIETPEGQRVLLETISNNRRAMRAALGI